MFRVILLAICVVFATGSPVISVESLEDELSCKLCLTFIENLHDSLLNQDKQIQVTHHLLSMCNELPENEKAQCQDIVHGASPETMDIMATQMKPQELCAHLGVCSAKEEVKESPRVEEPVESKHPEAGGACELCEFVVQAVDQYIENNKSAAAINATLYKICNKLPGVIKTTCLGFIPELVQVLAQGLDPKEACTKIHLCTSNAIVENEKPIEEDSQKAIAGGACELCEFVVQAVDQYIENNKSAAAINATLYKICNKLPDIIKTTCLGFIPELVQVLAQGLDPKEACTKIHLCTSNAIVENEKPIEEDSQKAIAGGACELCEFVVQAVDQYIENNKSAAAINATLYKICNKLPDIIKTTCLGFIPELVQVLAQGLDPKEACTKIHLCTSNAIVENEKPIEEVSKKVIAGGACELCEFVVQAVDQYIENNKSAAAINATLYKICDKLPGVIKTTCLGFIPELVQVLAQGLDPKEACTKIHLCTSNAIVENEKPIEEDSQKAIAGGACELCEFVVQAVDQYIENNKSAAAINATLYKICNKLPDIIKTTCLGFIPDLVQVLAQGLDPKQACTKIHLCTGTINVQRKVRNEIKNAELKANSECDLCKFVVQILDSIIGENKTEKSVNSTLFKICDSLPDEIKKTCYLFAPNLAKVLTEEFDPIRACVAIKLCQDQNKPVVEAPSLLKPNTKEVKSVQSQAGGACELCEFVVQAVDQYIENNRSEAAINATLYKICNKLPGVIKTTCLGFIPELVKVLAQGLDPKEACTKIHLCTSNAIVENEKPIEEVSKKVIAGGACELCEFVVQAVDQYIENNKSAAAINATLYKICDKLPGVIKTTCLGFIPELVQVLAQGLDPKEACTKIHLCTSNAIVENEKPIEEDSQKAIAGGACELCEFVVQAVDQYIENNKSAAAINATLYKICNKLPDIIKTTCLGFIPDLVQVLAQGLDPKEACTKIHLCTGNLNLHSHHEDSLKTNTIKGGACDLCQFVVQTIDQFVKENKSEAAINSTLYKICNKLPEPLKTTCLTFAPNLVKVLSEGLDPKEACTKINLCDGEREELSHHQKSNKNLQEKFGQASCDFCKLIVEQVDNFLQDNKSSAAINATLDKICNSLPPSFKALCKSYEPELIKALESGLDPENACSDIHVCSSDEKEKKRFASCDICKTEMRIIFPEDYKKWCSPECEEKSTEIVQPLVSKKGFTLKEEHKEKENGVGCELCKLIVQEVDTYVKDNKSEAAINATLYKVCNSLPVSLKLLCLTYVPELEKALKNGLDPEQACEKIHVCKNNTLIRVVRRSVSLSFNEVKCDLCKDIISSIDTDVYKDEDVVKKAVDDICDRFPEPVKDKCRQAVDPNWKNLWNDVFKNIASPGNLCHLLTLCKTK